MSREQSKLDHAAALGRVLGATVTAGRTDLVNGIARLTIAWPTGLTARAELLWRDDGWEWGDVSWPDSYSIDMACHLAGKQLKAEAVTAD